MLVAKSDKILIEPKFDVRHCSPLFETAAARCDAPVVRCYLII
jgi:hypothetical protein